MFCFAGTGEESQPGSRGTFEHVLYTSKYGIPAVASKTGEAAAVETGCVCGQGGVEQALRTCIGTEEQCMHI